MVYEPLYLIPCSLDIVTVLVCSKLKTNWIRLFLQIKSGRILNILRAFLIKQLFTSAVGYEMIIANSFATHTRRIIVNYPPHIPYMQNCCAKFCLDDQRMVESRVNSLAGSAVIWPLSSFCLMPYSLNCLHFWLKTINKTPTFIAVVSINHLCDDDFLQQRAKFISFYIYIYLTIIPRARMALSQ